jgi:hypothetical protein
MAVAVKMTIAVKVRSDSRVEIRLVGDEASICGRTSWISKH